jgi:cobalt-zinc-cadmium efflux system protein
MNTHCQGHSHKHEADALALRRMGGALAVTVAFVAVEAVAGVWGHSLALLSDAGHNLTDAAALGFSWYALALAAKPSNAAMTFGYHRVGILAALINSVSLVLIALFIFWQGIIRLEHPEPARGWLMIVVAAVAVAVNASIGARLHACSAANLNVRAAYLHMIGDAVSALGVLVGGIIVLCTHSPIADPIVSLLIGCLILWSSWGVLQESVNVLLEGTPLGLDMGEVEKAIASVPGVLGTHDLHVWTVGPGAVACSCHVLVAEQTVRQGQQILQAVVDELDRRFAINHTTVQVEVEGHESNEMYCTLRGNAPEHAGHRH